MSVDTSNSSDNLITAAFVGTAALLFGGVGVAAFLGSRRPVNELVGAVWPAKEARFAYHAMEAERALEEDPRLEVLKYLARHEGTAAEEDLPEEQWATLQQPQFRKFVVFRSAKSSRRQRGGELFVTTIAILTPEGQELARSLGVRGARVHPLVEEVYGVRAHGLINAPGKWLQAASELGVSPQHDPRAYRATAKLFR